jgi:hypothetical protein
LSRSARANKPAGQQCPAGLFVRLPQTSMM